MIKACVFDAFGTLFNLEIPQEHIKEVAGAKTNTILDVWRRKQLEYTWLRSLMQAYVPFNIVTREALQFAMKTARMEEERLFELLLPIYEKPTCFPPVRPMLAALKQNGIGTAILSNGTEKMLQSGVEHAGLTGLLDHVLSVDPLKVYKPDPRVYQLAVDTLKLNKREILFFSSNQWDVAGAGQFGLTTVWVNQYGQPEEVLPPKGHHVIDGLEEVSTERFLDNF